MSADSHDPLELLSSLGLSVETIAKCRSFAEVSEDMLNRFIENCRKQTETGELTWEVLNEAMRHAGNYLGREAPSPSNGEVQRSRINGNGRKGRGRAKKTNDLIGIMVGIAEEIQPCNVRALAYQFFNRKLIPSMAKKPVANVSRLATIAREEGFLPWSWIVDPTRQEETVSTWDHPEEYAHDVQRAYLKNKWNGQPKHISVWSEKSTVAGTLRPVLQKYEVPFQVLHGWSGAAPVRNAAVGNVERSQDTLMLYVGDFDPSGMSMSELDLPKRIARYSSDNPSKKISLDYAQERLCDLRFEIRRVALREHHTRLLGAAPKFPASDKKLDSRYPWFVENYGDWCWELDALSPADLRESLEQAILDELDPDAWNRYVRAEEVERRAIVETCSTWKTILQQDQEYSGDEEE
jgi:hypothetical protein